MRQTDPKLTVIHKIDKGLPDKSRDLQSWPKSKVKRDKFRKLLIGVYELMRFRWFHCNKGTSRSAEYFAAKLMN